jgi:hypothetical protein
MDVLNICLFIPTGRTFSFKKVEILTDNETVLVFSYSAMSDGEKKTATFQKNQICGWSTFSTSDQ